MVKSSQRSYRPSKKSKQHGHNYKNTGNGKTGTEEDIVMLDDEDNINSYKDADTSEEALYGDNTTPKSSSTSTTQSPSLSTSTSSTSTTRAPTQTDDDATVQASNAPVLNQTRVLLVVNLNCRSNPREAVIQLLRSFITQGQRSDNQFAVLPWWNSNRDTPIISTPEA